mmetsp:Transcript_21407/g.36458  ORF Transcript_21407/g.36458 Transcript_21407/m.36458 type:complete len:96 (-) Transcript_21407:510-797(-)
MTTTLMVGLSLGDVPVCPVVVCHCYHMEDRNFPRRTTTEEGAVIIVIIIILLVAMVMLAVAVLNGIVVRVGKYCIIGIQPLMGVDGDPPFVICSY